MRKLRTFVSVAVLASASAVAQAETCTLYQKYRKEFFGVACNGQSNFREVTAAGGAGTFYARRVPKCDADGTDGSCTQNFVKSLDGTRAFYHVDPAPDSNRWIVFFDGGGSCGQMAGVNAAQACYEDDPSRPFRGYEAAAGDALEMTTAHPAGSPVVANRKVGTGILSPSANNVPFSGYNRVWVNKSSFDRFMGNGTDNTQPFDGDDLELYFHGRRIVKSMLKDLNRSNGVIVLGGETVPDLSEADSVLFVGESGGGGGLIQNAEYLKGLMAVEAPAALVNFAPSSRMISWLEAEAYFAGTGDLFDDVYAGATSVLKNPAGGGPAAVAITYSQAAFEPGGAVRDLVASWGDPASATYPFLDASCVAAHGSGHWKCYDEGHVALYHADENMFFYESLLDAVHAGEGSPVFWMETGDFGAGPIALDPGFIWNPPGNYIYAQARAERILYTIDQILQNPLHRGARGFYAPVLNAHTQVKQPGFWSATLDCPLGGHTWSFKDALAAWEADNNAGACAAPGCDLAAVEDALATYQITFSDGTHNGGGWTP
jgi:pectinacetylesterase